MFTMPLDGVDDEHIIKMAEVIITMYGDKILLGYYTKKKMSKLQKSEKMLQEILYESHANVKAILKDGDMFGEQAALRDGVRSASVRATEDCHLAYLSKDDFDHLYQMHWKGKTDRGINFLKDLSVFESLSRQHLQRLTTMVQRKDVIKG